MWIARLIRWWREALHNRARDLRVMMGKYPKYHASNDVTRRDDVLNGSGHFPLSEYFDSHHRPGEGGVGSDSPCGCCGIAGVAGYDFRADPDRKDSLREDEELILEPTLWWRYRRDVLDKEERGDGKA